MNEMVHQLVRTLFSKDSLDEVELQDIQSLARQYPYFSPLQLILAEKMKPGHPGAYDRQLQRASVYFHDPLWFDFLLNRDEYAQSGLISVEKEKEIENNPLIPRIERGRPSNPEILNEVYGFRPEPNVQDQTAQELETALQNDEVEPEKEILDPSPEEVLKQEAILPVKEESEITESENEEEESPIVEESDSPAPLLPQREFSIKPLAESENVLTFEPYHTVDYFASQGIKLTTEDKSSEDNFSKQLRSFTEWLKAMKKLPDAEIAKNLDSGSESQVKSLAEHSLDEREVVTEAMAEVWEKQGNYEKALAIYNKLSLSNPSKSAYFAAKIEQLKKEI